MLICLCKLKGGKMAKTDVIIANMYIALLLKDEPNLLTCGAVIYLMLACFFFWKEGLK